MRMTLLGRGRNGRQLGRWVRPVQGDTSLVGKLPQAARQNVGVDRSSRKIRARGREAAVGFLSGFLYRGRRERPLTRVERRQLTVLAVATLAGLVVVIVGVILLVPGDDRLGPLLMLTGTLIVSAAGFLSRRHLLPLQRRRFHAAAIGVIALLWMVSIVGYLRGW